MQLSLAGLMCTLPFVVRRATTVSVATGSLRQSLGFFDGFDSLTWVVIGLQATGGLLAGIYSMVMMQAGPLADLSVPA